MKPNKKGKIMLNKEEKNIVEIEAMLIVAGSTYAGANPRAVAEEWVAEDFSPSEVSEWIDARVWSPYTASDLRDESIPACIIIKSMASYDWGSDEIDPVYRLCNGSISVGEFLAELQGGAA
jgi:hypothetical protein